MASPNEDNAVQDAAVAADNAENNDQGGAAEQAGDGKRKKRQPRKKKAKEPRVKKEKTPRVKKEKPPKVKKEKPPKAKKVKEPKPKKPPKEKKEKQPREKAERGDRRRRPGVAVFLIILCLIGAVVGMYYFNLFDIKTKVIDFFISQDTQYKQAIDAREKYEGKEEALNQRQVELAEKEKELTEKETQLNEREQDIKDQEKELKTSSSSSGSGSRTAAGTAPDGLDQSQIALIMEGMKVDNAAAILNTITDNTWIAQLLGEMDEKRAGKILAAIDVEKAAVITRLMSDIESDAIYVD